ncbi:hypothetical protein FZI85_27285 [Mycobacterium sp. CBMA293]|uniref:Uncharacterized protein n=1 Tax=Mycolicibacterium sp. CBMA 213 TaxID=1968788 RepID=A0A1S6GKM6_9MYCO|nr:MULTISPECIES: hypothetical protein [unclassified Mycolicibacterium]AQS22393.1 hypothetical protein pCBMA213_2_00029 [Mycolicibacterium sp. CBMA 213]MUL48452.1 hypothetical protein [Mycolicibacterium sp. CBMA 360]MUL62310.1 hypothetical protein [Mycolicibacterium sp. CBMA 335]MUM04447.1 hypothetical protein [Mycolicibacterium sp. CBMA 213]MUM14710.1 hypothetical protein [Mycolicibacterium sp. CBMA 293]
MTSEEPRWDVSIGYRSPTWWTENEQRGERFLQTTGDDSTRPRLTSEAINWDQLGMTPRWLEEDTCECVAAIEPRNTWGQGSREWARFLAGTQARNETALVISMAGGAEERTDVFGGPTASIHLPAATYCSVGGPRIELASTPKLAEGLSPADRDLALRLSNIRQRDSSSHWWSLHLTGAYIESGGGGPSGQVAPVGTFTALLNSAAGEVVAGVWVSEDGAVRHYIIPWLSSWKTVLEWLSRNAIPEYVPSAKRRIHARIGEEPRLQTHREQTALSEVAQLEEEYAARKGRLVQEVADAQAEADPLRHDLLFGSSDTLKDAVRKVLEEAGLSVQDVDTLLGQTGNADLLVEVDGRWRLVEVKSASGRASEDLVADALRHLSTWPQFRPDITVEGITLIVSSQIRLHPLDRNPAVYTRREFVESLTIPVVGIMELFNAWRARDFGAIDAIVLGSSIPMAAPTVQPPEPEVPRSAAPPPAKRGRLRRLFGRGN